MTEPRPFDPDRFKELARTLFDQLGGATTSAMVWLGDHLGLYRELHANGPATSAELAARTGLDERWLREWLRQQGAAGLLDFDAQERFALTPEGVALFADENHPAFGMGMFCQLPQLFQVLERLPEAFRSGRGLPYDAFGPEGARGVERGFAPWYRTLFVRTLKKQMGGVAERLEAGAEGADVGCGSGIALIELAKAFPKSRFHGYDISRHALERAEKNRVEAGVENVAFHDVSEEPLPADGRFALTMTMDCLHDMTHPQQIVRAIRGAIAADGAWLVADIKARDRYADNVEKNPMAPLMYGISVMSCMSSALSEEGGAGLGTLGLPPEKLEAMAREEGFTKFRKLEIDHPVNAFYEVRP